MRELRSVPSEVKLEQDPQSEAAIALAAKGASAVPFLIAALDDKESQVRLLAAWALGEIGDGRSAGALALRLGDGDGFVRAAAMTALVQTGPSAVNALLEALTAEDAYPRQLAACALGAVGDRRATGGLSALVEDVEPGVRRAVAEALGRIGGLEATGLLVRLLGDEDPVVRRHTVWALRENLAPEQLGEELEGSGGILIERLGHREEKVRTGATDVLARLGEPAAPLLIRALASGDGMVRRQAAEALWHMQTQDHRAAEPLLAALEDVDGELRAYAAGALGGVGDHRAVEPLIAALKDDHARVRELAVEALGRLGDERAIPALATVLHDEEAEMRREAVASLEEIGPAALDPLMTALHDEDREVRAAAAASLGRIGDPRAVGSLVAALEDLDLGHTGESAQSARRRRGLLIAALGQMRGNRQAIEALVHLLEVIPRRDHYTLNPVNWALQNATGEHVYSGSTYAGNQAEPIVEGWQTWLAASGAAGHPDVTGEDRKDRRSFKEAMKAGRAASPSG